MWFFNHELFGGIYAQLTSFMHNYLGVFIHKETDVTSWHGSRQSYHNDHAHSMAWICPYDSCLECIAAPQGQEHPQLWDGHSPNHRVHHTKCTIIHKQAHTHTHTHTHTYTYIMHNAITQSKKAKQTLPTFQGYGPTRYRKSKSKIFIPKECGPSKVQER